MPFASLNATAMVRNEPPAAIAQPVRGSVRRRHVTAASVTTATRAKPSSQPAWPPSASLSRRNGPLLPPKTRPPPGPPPGREPPPPPRPPAGPPAPPRRPARLPVEAPDAVVAPDQRPDAVVARPG